MSELAVQSGIAPAGMWRTYRALVLQDFRLRVAGSRLGLLWLVLQPLLFMLVTSTVFFGFLGVRFEGAENLQGYILHLLAGFVVWLGFNEALGKAAPALIERAHLLRNAPLPRLVVPLVPLAGAMAYQGVCLLLLALAVTVSGHFSWNAVLLVPAIFFQIIFLMGLSWFLAVLSVCYRDVQYLLAFFLMVWLYLSPIFFPASVIPESFQGVLVMANPLALLAQVFRAALLGEAVSPPVWGSLAVISITTFVSGWAFFRRVESAVVDLL